MTAVAERIEPPELFDFFVEQRAAMGLTIVPLDGHSGSTLLSTLRGGGSSDSCATGTSRAPASRSSSSASGRPCRPDRPRSPCAQGPPCVPEPSTAARSRPPGAGGAPARHHPSRFAPGRRRPPHPGDRHPSRGSDPPGTRAVARLPAPVAGRPATGRGGGMSWVDRTRRSRRQSRGRSPTPGDDTGVTPTAVGVASRSPNGAGQRQRERQRQRDQRERARSRRRRRDGRRRSRAGPRTVGQARAGGATRASPSPTARTSVR